MVVTAVFPSFMSDGLSAVTDVAVQLEQQHRLPIPRRVAARRLFICCFMFAFFSDSFILIQVQTMAGGPGER